MWKKNPELLLEESIFLNRTIVEISFNLSLIYASISPSFCTVNLYWVYHTYWPHMGSFPVCVPWFAGFVSRLKSLWTTSIPRATTLLSTDHAQRVYSAIPQTQWACLNGYSSTWAEHSGPYWAQPGCVAARQLTSQKKVNGNVSFRPFCALFVHTGKGSKYSS